MISLALVACGKAKRAEVAPARALYVGSLFRAALGHALATCAEVRIVSALYGLVELETPIAPYDLRIEQHGGRTARAVWGARVADAVVEAFPARAIAATLLMGAAYAEALAPELEARRVAWTRPVAGLTLGAQLRFYAEHRRALAKG